MNIVKITGRVIAAASLVGLVSSQAFAGDCRTNNRVFPAVQDTMTMSCKSFSGATTSGVATAQNAGGSKTVNTNLTAGIQVLSQGMTNAGAIVCTSQDSTVNGSAGGVTFCPATAVLWRGFLNHAL